MTNDPNDRLAAIILCAAILALTSLAYVLGTLQGTEKVQQEAIKNGHAVWAADTQGKSVFQWKELAK